MEEVLAGSGRGVILPTSWVMGPVGKNFVLTMLRLHRDREQIVFVEDQVRAPQHRHPGGGLLAGDHGPGAVAGAALVRCRRRQLL